jgi:hypothetical protein
MLKNHPVAASPQRFTLPFSALTPHPIGPNKYIPIYSNLFQQATIIRLFVQIRDNYQTQYNYAAEFFYPAFEKYY